MEGRLLLKNCCLVDEAGRVRTGMALVVEEGRVCRVAPDEEVPVLPGDWEVACRGRLVAPGRVDCHAHLVGGLLVPPTGEVRLRSPESRHALERHMAEHLTAADVAVLARFAVARALLEGVTLTVEHLACPGDVAGGLEAQARVAAELGMRLLVGHATQGLAGEGAEAQVEANADFARRVQGHPLVRGAVGFHASWTCGDTLLRRVGRLREDSEAPVLFHLSEDAHDEAATLSRYGQRVLPRLEGFGLLGPWAVVSHARALTQEEAVRLVRSGSFLALTPRAGASGATLEAAWAHRAPVGLGTVGHGSLRDAVCAVSDEAVEAARAGRLEDPDAAVAWLHTEAPALLRSRLFGLPSAVVGEGALADLVVYEGVPLVEGRTGRALDGVERLGRASVAWTLVSGRVAVREGRLLGTDILALAQEASLVLADVWARAGRSQESGALGPVRSS